jgi:hypothetical protein
MPRAQQPGRIVGTVRLCVGIASFVLSPALTGSAAAQPATVHADRASWEAAVHDVTTVDFEGLAAPGGYVFYRSEGLSLAGLSFLGSFDGGFYLAAADSAFNGGNYDWGSGDSLQGPSTLSVGSASGGPNPKIRITLPPGTTAFATDLMTWTRSDIPMTITLSTGESFIRNSLPRPGRAFLGVTSDAEIAFVDITAAPTTAYPSVDNVSVGQKGAGGPALTSLTLKKPLVAGCKPMTGTVTLSAPAPAGGAVVTLSETLASGSVPASVTIPAGATSKTFKVVTTARADAETATVSATYAGTTLIKPLTIRPISVLSIPITPTTLVGGALSTGVVKLECKAAPGPIFVELGSTLPDAAGTTVPNVLVPVGVQTAPVTVTTSPVTKTTKPKITATANGLTKSKTLTVTP